MIKYGFFHLPPPIHGSAQIGKIIKNNFNLIDVLDISLMDNISSHGSLNLIKIRKIYNQIYYVLFTNFNNAKVVYIPSSKGLSILRDFMLIFILVLKNVKIYSFYLNTNADQSNFIFKILHKFILRNSFVILTSKIFITDLLSVNPEKLYFCNLGISCPTSKLIHPDVSKVINIGFFSNWYLSKGIEDYINIINIINEDDNNFHFHLAGQQGDLSISDVNSQINITDNVTIVGPVYNDNKFKFLSSLDVLLYPSKDDTFPLSILEAMSQGVYTISTNVGAISEILNNPITGMVINEFDYIETVINVLKNNLVLNRNNITAGTPMT